MKTNATLKIPRLAKPNEILQIDAPMKSPTIVILASACVGLGAGWWIHSQQQGADMRAERAMKLKIVDEAASLRSQLRREADQNQRLTADLLARDESLEELSNRWFTAQSELDQVMARISETEHALALARSDAKSHRTRVAQLEARSTDWTAKLDELNESIEILNQEIKSTEAQLASAHDDREFLIEELQRLQTEKNELLRQFNDLKTVRERYAMLKRESVISRRLEWLHSGVYQRHDRKGAQTLLGNIRPLDPSPQPVDGKLNVEIDQTHGSRITTPN
jgi:predicted  nucleic acid-binding Zn-ribbon protein